MNTAKPSIPSSDGGAADDLIEELARLMAQGAQENCAQENSSSAPPTGAAGSVVQDLAGETSAGGFASSGPNLGFPRPDIGKTPGQEPPRPNLPPHSSATSLGGAKGLGRLAFSSPARLATSQSIAPQAGEGANDKSSQNPLPHPLPRDFTKSAEPESPAPALATPVPPVSKTPLSNDPIVDDPIADLIRVQAQLDADTGAKESESKIESGDQGARDEKSAAPAPRPAATPKPARAPEAQEAAASPKKSDKFRVPPVFGLAGKPSKPGKPLAQVAPPVARVEPFLSREADAGKGSGAARGRDALDEIENLIGNAVRVDFSEEPGAEAAKAAPLRAQDSSFMRPDAPASPPSRETAPAKVTAQPSAQDNSVDSAEEAILQAMAAIGKTAQEHGAGAPPKDSAPPKDIFTDDRLEQTPAGKPDENDSAGLAARNFEKSGTKSGRVSRFLVPAGAGIVLIAAILGGYWVLTNGTDNGDAPVLVADNTPSKQAPPPAQGQEGSGGQPTVFSEVASNTGAATNERLVSRDQTGDLIGNEIRRVTTSDTTETGLANRRVRTVTVRPDGTIISGDEAVAGGQALPVARPNVPELPANTLNPELTNTVIASLPEALAANNAQTATVAAPTPAPDAIIAPVPRPRPADRAALTGKGNAQNTSIPPQQTAPETTTTNTGALDLIAGIATSPPLSPAPTPVPGNTIANPAAWVQMASRRSEAAANQSALTLQTKYAAVLGSAKLEVQRIDLGDRGIFYRVLLPAASLNEASAVCSAIKGAGGDCFTRNK